MRCERCYETPGICPSFRYAHVRVVGESRRIVNRPYPCPDCNGTGRVPAANKPEANSDERG